MMKSINNTNIHNNNNNNNEEDYVKLPDMLQFLNSTGNLM